LKDAVPKPRNEEKNAFAAGSLHHSTLDRHPEMNARVTTADAEQTAVAAFRPWRGS